MKLHLFIQTGNLDFAEQYIRSALPGPYRIFSIEDNYKLFIFSTTNEKCKILLKPNNHFRIVDDDIKLYREGYSYYQDCNKIVSEVFLEKCMERRNYCRKKCLLVELEDIKCNSLMELKTRDGDYYRHFISHQLNIDVKSLNDIAWLFYLMFGNEIVYCNEKYYTFRFPIWVECDDILDMLANRLIPELIEYDVKDSTIKYINKNVSGINIKNIIPHINNLITFELPGDTPGHLLVFNNGVYDFNDDLLVDDEDLVRGMYLTSSTHIDYKVVDTSPAEKFLRELFPDDEQYRFHNLYKSSLLCGGNRDKIFLVELGNGNNGKSVLEKLDLLLFGDYACVANSSIVTNPKPAESAATPELLDLREKRVVFINEPENKPLNVARVKELTGNDLQRARGLYNKEIQSFELQCKFIMVCNVANLTTTSDTAFWNRVEVLDFKTEFKEIEKEDETKYIRKMNKKVDLQAILPSYLSLLVKTHREYISLKTIRNICDTKHIVRYKCDTVYRFSEDTNLLELSISKAYETFKHWCFRNNRTVTASNTFEHNMGLLYAITDGIVKRKEH